MLSRYSLLILINLAIMIPLLGMASAIIYVVMPMFDVYVTLNLRDCIWALILGFGSSFASLAMSKWLVKRRYTMVQITDPSSSKELLLLNAAAVLSKEVHIKTPEIWIYKDIEPNAFTTGMTKNSAMIAISTGMMDMSDMDIKSIISHEVGHIYYGDMVTTTLIQGLFNAVNIFIAAWITRSIYERSYILGLISSIMIQIVLSVISAIPLAWYSRYREYKADGFSAEMYGTNSMIHALNSLDQRSKQILLSKKMDYSDVGFIPRNPDQMATAKIFSSHSVILGAHNSFWKSLFASHPKTSDRIKALEDNRR